MTKISTCTRRTVKRVGIDAGLRMLAAAGYDALDLSLDLYNDQLRDGGWQPIAAEYRAIAAELGIHFNQAHAPFGGGPLPDGRSNYTVNLVPLIPAALEMAAAAGVETVVVHPFTNGSVGFFGHEDELMYENLEFFNRLAPIARSLGVKIAIENLWLKSATTESLINGPCADPREHIKYIDALAAPDVFTLCLDLGHSALVGRDPAAVIRTLGHDRLGALHVHDVDYKKDMHTLPYQSRLDWDSITAALGEIDYKGYLTLEADHFIANVPDELLAHSTKYMAATARYLASRIDAARPAK